MQVMHPYMPALQHYAQVYIEAQNGKIKSKAVPLIRESASMNHHYHGIDPLFDPMTAHARIMLWILVSMNGVGGQECRRAVPQVFALLRMPFSDFTNQRSESS